MCAPKYQKPVRCPNWRRTSSKTFQGVASTKMGIWVYITREAEISLLAIRAFYSKKTTAVLKRCLAGNDKGKDLGRNRKAHIATTQNSSFPTKSSHFLFLHGFLHEEVKQNSWLYRDLWGYCLGCFLWLLSPSLGL